MEKRKPEKVVTQFLQHRATDAAPSLAAKLALKGVSKRRGHALAAPTVPLAIRLRIPPCVSLSLSLSPSPSLSLSLSLSMASAELTVD